MLLFEQNVTENIRPKNGALQKNPFLGLILDLALHRLDIWYVASPSGPEPSLFKNCHGVKNGPPRGSNVLHRLNIGKT